MTYALWACAIILTISAILVLVRVERGPTMLDRMVGLDLFTAILLGAVVLISAAGRRTDLVAVLVVLALVGFIGSTTVARFAGAETTADKRILTKEEVERVLAKEASEREDDMRDPVHDVDRLEEEQLTGEMKAVSADNPPLTRLERKRREIPRDSLDETYPDPEDPSRGEAEDTAVRPEAGQEPRREGERRG